MHEQLSMKDFYPDYEETPERSEMSRNVKFSAPEQIDIAKIKQYLLQNLTQRQMAEKMNCTEETISRKISKWMQTNDFNQWLDSWWLKLAMELSKNVETKVEVFRQLTRLKTAKQTKEIKADINTQTQTLISQQNDILIEFSRKRNESRNRPS